MRETADLAVSKPVKRNANPPPYTVLHCRAGGRHQVGWCYMMCEPVDGRGLCGRQAPHASVDTPTRRAIRAYKARQKRSRNTPH
jgi:hypothetical protein